MFANVLFLVLDPVFVSRVAEGLEFDADRIELIEQRRGTDPTLHHIAMALRAGVQSGAALDRMYGEALSTALAVHLLGDQEKTGAIPTSHRMSPASLVAEATASRAIPRSKHGLDLA